MNHLEVDLMPDKLTDVVNPIFDHCWPEKKEAGMKNT